MTAVPSTASAQTTLTGAARRPALSAAGALIAGVVAHRILPDLPQAYLALAAAGAIAAVAGRRWAIASTALLALSVMLLGVAVAQLEAFHFADDHIVAFTGDAERLAEVELVIDQPPRVLTVPTGGGRPLPPRQVTQGEVTRVKTHGGWRAASGRILVQISPPKADLAYGQRVTIHGMLGRPAGADNPGQFDWKSYYREQRVLASIDAPHPENVRVLAQGGFAPVNWLRKHARAALERGFTKSQSVDHALLRALLLGDGDPQLRDIQDDFQRTGTSHHLSISGMHVAVLGGLIFFCCRVMRMSPRKSATAMMAFVVLYGLVALPAPPVLRSIILCLSAGTGILLRRTIDGVQLLALTVFLMLVVCPLDLYNAGFQLSFLTVLGLMVYADRLTARLDRRSEDERVLLSFGITPGRMGSIRNWAKSSAIDAICTGVVAWAVSAPLILEHFDQHNPWAVAAGILLAIPVFASMVAGLLKVVLTIALPWFAGAWAWLAMWPVEAMRGMVAWLAKWPGSDVPVPALPMVIVLIYFAMIALPLIRTARPRLKWTFRGLAATAGLSVFALPLLVGLAPRGGAGGVEDLRLTLLSVGAGQCAVLELPSGKTILFDAGSSTIADLERRCIQPFLRHEGVSRVDAIYISHANYDHFGAVAQAAEAYAAREVVTTPYFRKHAAKNYPARLMLDKLAALKVPVRAAAAGERTDLGDGCWLEFLWPPADAGALDENNSCQVMRLTFGGRSILLTGDIQAKAEAALLAEPDKLRADVLVAPHHGSAEETTGRFIDAVAAPLLLASDDRTPSGKQRAFDKLIADGETPRRLLRTHLGGAITVTISRDGAIGVTTFLKN